MKILYLIFFCILSSSCASQYQLEEKSPVEIGNAYFQKTVGGREETPVEIKIFIPVGSREVKLDSIYFRNQVATLKLEGPTTYSGVFIISKNSDLVMSSDPKDEYGNDIQLNPTDFPFTLKKDEAVISYKKGDEIRYFKIQNIVEKATKFLPVKNRENN